jgi:hypothetical protein
MAENDPTELRLLQERFPTLSEDFAGRHRSVLLSLLQRTDGNPPDYTKPGQWGTSAKPHMVYVWRSGDKRWEENVLEPFDDCDNIVIEVAVRYIDVQCPPAKGFAQLVKAAVKDARQLAEAHECPDECAGTYIDIIHKHWFCQEDDLVIEIQLQKLCNTA